MSNVYHCLQCLLTVCPLSRLIQDIRSVVDVFLHPINNDLLLLLLIFFVLLLFYLQLPVKLDYNLAHNILRLFDDLPIFFFNHKWN